MENKKVNVRRYNRRKQFYRFTLGVQQFINYPVINILWVAYAVGVSFFINGERKLISHFEMSSFIMPIFRGCIQFIEIFFPVICFVGIVQFIGTVTAIRDEALVGKAFGNNRDYLNESPILSGKKTKKGITTREFYTTISMEEWQNKAEDICDKLNIHLIADITYGGKDENKGYLRKMISAKGRKPCNRGVLYDDSI